MVGDHHSNPNFLYNRLISKCNYFINKLYDFNVWDNVTTATLTATCEIIVISS